MVSTRSSSNKKKLVAAKTLFGYIKIDGTHSGTTFIQ